MTLRDAVLERAGYLQHEGCFGDPGFRWLQRYQRAAFLLHEEGLDLMWKQGYPPLLKLQRVIDWAVSKGVRL